MNIYEIFLKIIWIVVALSLVPICTYTIFYIITRLIALFTIIGGSISAILGFNHQSTDKKTKKIILNIDKIFWISETILLLAIIIFYFFKVQYSSIMLYLVGAIIAIHIIVSIIVGLIYGPKIKIHFFKNNQRCKTSLNSDKMEEEQKKKDDEKYKTELAYEKKFKKRYGKIAWELYNDLKILGCVFYLIYGLWMMFSYMIIDMIESD